MTAPEMRPAMLDDTALDTVRRLEATLGTTVVAYEAESPYATLDAEQLATVQRIESDLGVRLLAYRR